MSFTPPGTDQSVNPLKVTYDSSQSVDVDAHVELRQPAAAVNAACGAPNTTCATFAARSIPAHLEARIRDGLTTPQGQPESRIELDDIPRPGGIQPDFRADVTLGQQDAAPLLAHAELDGLSRFVRIRAVQGLDQTLQRLEFHTCDWDFTALSCAAGTDQPVASLSFSLHNWTTRPVNLPPPSPTTSQFANLVARGTPDPTKVRFEAAGKVASIDEIDYRNTGDVFGVRTKVGSGRDFSTHVDLGDVNFTPSDPTKHRLDIVGDANIVALPSALDFCFRQSGKPITAGSGSFTAPCEAANPFGDSSPLTTSPLSVAYRVSAPFNVTTAVSLTDRAPTTASRPTITSSRASSTSPTCPPT